MPRRSAIPLSPEALECERNAYKTLALELEEKNLHLAEMLKREREVPTMDFAYAEARSGQLAAYWLWSTQFFPDCTQLAMTSSCLFRTPLGAQGQGHPGALDISHTNLREGGRVPSGMSFAVSAVKVDLKCKDAETRINVVQNGVLRWDFVQCIVDMGPLSVFSWQNDYTEGSFVIGSWPKKSSHTPLNRFGRDGVDLSANTTFGVRLEFGRDAKPPKADVEVRVCLGGGFSTVIVIG